MRQNWAKYELVVSWSLSDGDRRVIGNKTGATRLGFAVMLKFFELEARLPEGPDEVPVEAVAYLADAVGVDWRAFAGYRWQGRTARMQSGAGS